MGYKKAFPQIVTYILQKTFFKHAQRTEKLYAYILFKYGFYCP